MMRVGYARVVWWLVVVVEGLGFKPVVMLFHRQPRARSISCDS